MTGTQPPLYIHTYRQTYIQRHIQTDRGAERVATMRVLGVVVNSKLTMKDHLDHRLSSCASSIYALRMLRVHGLQDKQIHVVASMTTLASMLYSSPTWW